MRILLGCVWLLLLVAGAAWHYGPGQNYLKLDRAAATVRAADQAVREENYTEAVTLYEEAMKALPADRVGEVRKLRVQKAKAQMLSKQLPEAHADLQNLMDELTADKAADPATVKEARSALAQSQYYITWLMRLEGLAREMWEPEIEGARQHYRLLAEEAKASGDAAGAKRYQQDLESSIRLARMDLGELQGLPLPSQ
jgi:hypothetical protein